MPRDVGLGIATTFGQERAMPTWLACVARVRVDRSSGHVTVEMLTIVVDAGTIIHPDSAEAQVEGALLWGREWPLHEGSEFINGQLKAQPRHLPRLRMADVRRKSRLSFSQVRKPWLGSENKRPLGLTGDQKCGSSPPVARVLPHPIRPAAVVKALAHRT